MKLSYEAVLSLLNEAAAWPGPMVTISKDRLVDICDTALYAVKPVDECEPQLEKGQK